APTLVFAMSDVMAVGALPATRAAGPTIGRPVSVGGFDDITPAIDVTPALTTVHIPLAGLGYQAAAPAIHPEAPAPQLPLSDPVPASTPPVPPSGAGEGNDRHAS